MPHSEAIASATGKRITAGDEPDNLNLRRSPKWNRQKHTLSFGLLAQGAQKIKRLNGLKNAATKETLMFASNVKQNFLILTLKINMGCRYRAIE